MNLKPGPEALNFGNTLFRIQEISWIKAQGTTLPEKIVKVGLILLAGAFVWAMAQAKGSYQNLECLLAAFPLYLAFTIGSDFRLASTGDLEEAYEDRVGRSRKLFEGWIEGLAKKHPHWIHLNGKDYAYLINPEKIAWVKTRVQVKFLPLVVALVFYGYPFVPQVDVDLTTTPILSDFKVLYFEPSNLGPLTLVCYLLIAVSMAAFLASVQRSVELCAPGGVFDTLRVSAEDQVTLLGRISGNLGASRPQATPKEAASPRTSPAEKPAAPKPKASPNAHKPTVPVRTTKPAEMPTVAVKAPPEAERPTVEVKAKETPKPVESSSRS